MKRVIIMSVELRFVASLLPGQGYDLRRRLLP